jgi:hypothetical protein
MFPASANGVLGTSVSGFLGDATGETSSIVALTFSDTIPATLVAAGASNTCALFENGKIRCWGSNSDIIGTAQVSGLLVVMFCFICVFFFFVCSKKKKKKK